MSRDCRHISEAAQLSAPLARRQRTASRPGAPSLYNPRELQAFAAPETPGTDKEKTGTGTGEEHAASGRCHSST